MNNLKHFFTLSLLLFVFSLSAQDRVWPGDANNNGVVNEADLFYLGLGFGREGPARKTVSAAFEAQPIADVWAVSAIGGLDFVYADCDGNGVIDSNDVQVIVQNFGKSHNDVVFQPDVILEGTPGISPAFAVSETIDLSIQPNTRVKEILLDLGSLDIPVASLKGLSFYIKVDPQAFDATKTTFEFDDNGWLPDDENAQSFTIQQSTGRSGPGDLVVAYTRTGAAVAGNGIGPIGTISVSPNTGFILEDDLPNFKITIDSIILFDDLNNQVPILGTQINLMPDGFRDSTIIDSTICQGESVLFNDELLTENGTYRDTFMNAVGGDSIIILNLMVTGTFQTNLSGTICEGGSQLFNGQSLTTTGIYRDTLSAVNGCDSFIVFNFTVLPNRETMLNDTICQGEEIIFGGNNYSESGTYRDTLQAANGCDSVAILNLTVNDTLQTLLTRTICAGDNFLFNGLILTEAGTYRDTLQAANGCAQYIVLELSVAEELNTDISQTICEGEFFEFDNQELRTAGFYRQTLQAADGCDSTITLDLVVLPTVEHTINETICVGDTREFVGQQLTVSGTYNATLTGSNGCDSLLIFHLTVADSAQTTINQTICEGSTYDFNGQSLTIAGIYRDTLSTTNGCDSFLVLDLKVSDRYETEMNKVICEGETMSFNGRNLTLSGTYRDTFVAINGCDSLVTLDLNIATISFTAIQDEICQGGSTNFNGQVLSQTGTYLDTLQGISGCDSLVELSLTVNESLESTTEQTICQGDTVRFYNFILTTTNSYMVTLQTDEGCDSMVIMNLQVLEEVETTIDTTICPEDSLLFGGLTISEAGTYTQMMSTVAGCDSLVTMNLSIGAAGQGGCLSTSIEEEYLESIKIYPNPVTQNLFIHSPDVKMTDIRLINLTGQVIIERTFSNVNSPIQAALDLQNLVPGVYWVMIQTEYGLRQEKVLKM